MPEVDAATGKSINPHIPRKCSIPALACHFSYSVAVYANLRLAEFMAQAPWYMDTGVGPSLSHHKNTKVYNADPSKLDSRYDRGGKAHVQAVTKYRKGACPNCGAMHSVKDCLERPRKIGAKFSGKDFAADEMAVAKRVDDFDAKRDRWDGYDPAMYSKVIEEHQALEEARRQLREEEIDKTTDIKTVEKVAKVGKKKQKKKDEDNDDFGSSDESADDEEERYAEGADAVGQKVDTKTRITVRNLRIREDTAKYLLNLDVDSAYYDPKTRSMREAPNPDKGDAAFHGENFVRHSGDAQEMQRLQLFAWQSEQRGHDVHALSNPTAAAAVYKEYLQKKDKLKDTSKTSILDRYGGEEHLQRVPKELLAGQTENYVEYSRSGQLVKGQETIKARSKYDEDVFPGNHKSVWGSWFDLATHRWGYRCCHSYIKGSYCAGQAGIDAEREEAAGGGRILMPAPTATSAPGKSMAEMHASKTAEERERERKEYDDKLASSGKRKQDDGVVTESDMEEYRRKKSRGNIEDPLANVNSEELLPMT